MTTETVDTHTPAQMAVWLRETAVNTRAHSDTDRLAAHVAFRLEQAADLLDAYQQFHDWAAPQCTDNAAQLNEIERLVERERQAAIVLATALAGGGSPEQAHWMHDAAAWLNNRSAPDVPALQPPVEHSISCASWYANPESSERYPCNCTAGTRS